MPAHSNHIIIVVWLERSFHCVSTAVNSIALAAVLHRACITLMLVAKALQRSKCLATAAPALTCGIA